MMENAMYFRRFAALSVFWSLAATESHAATQASKVHSNTATRPKLKKSTPPTSRPEEIIVSARIFPDGATGASTGAG